LRLGLYEGKAHSLLAQCPVINISFRQLSPRGGGKSNSPATPEFILPCVAPPAFEEPDDDDIEAWLAESEGGSSAVEPKDLVMAICGFEGVVQVGAI
jgi:hypothetical protein